MTAKRTIIVTGAGGGIGAAIARHLADNQTNLCLHTRSNESGLEAVASDAQANGATVITHLSDLSASASASELIDKCVSELSGLDGLAHNAGFADFTPFDDVGSSQTNYAFESMPGAFLRLLQSAHKPLSQSPAARVVAVSSFVAHRYYLGGDAFPASAGAKAALESFVRSAAVHMAKDGITVNTVAPGYIRKDKEIGEAPNETLARRKGGDRIPLGRVGLPEDIAPAVAFLLSAQAAYITGQLLHVDGGITL